MRFEQFIIDAEAAASKSKDPSTKVGCTILDDDFNILASGWNGFPRGVKDTDERLGDRSVRLALTVHAEANAIAASARTGRCLKGGTIVVTSLFPCVDCAGLIVQAGIRRVVAPRIRAESKWKESNEMAKVIFLESGVEVVEL